MSQAARLPSNVMEFAWRNTKHRLPFRIISNFPLRTFGHSLAIEAKAWAWQACCGVFSAACVGEWKAATAAITSKIFLISAPKFRTRYRFKQVLGQGRIGIETTAAVHSHVAVGSFATGSIDQQVKDALLLRINADPRRLLVRHRCLAATTRCRDWPGAGHPNVPRHFFLRFGLSSEAVFCCKRFEATAQGPRANRTRNRLPRSGSPMIAAYWADLDHEGERTQLGLGPGRS